MKVFAHSARLSRTGRPLALFCVLLTASLLWSGCDDEGGDGGEDTCVGLNCSESDFKQPDTGADTGADAADTNIDTNVTSCSPGQVQCLDGTTLRLCINGNWEETLCIDSVCDADAGACVSSACPVAGQPFQCENDTQERICSDNQLSYTLRDCPTGETCLATRCGVNVCTPTARRCRDASTVEICSDDGSGWVEAPAEEQCESNEVCGASGQCSSLCELNAKTASFLGCDYYVVDMDNADASAGGDPTSPATDDQPFGITVSNPHPQLTASVAVTGAGQTINRDVPPASLQLIDLPSSTDVDSAGLFNDATFHVVSSIPVTVHQFNPVNGVGVFSNDASLLLPVNALGREYVALNWPSTPTVQPEVYIDIVATEANTTVEVTSPIRIPGSGSFTEVPPNTPRTFTMNAGQLLHLLNDGSEGADLSGLTITASAPIAVFAGTRCMISSDQCCCDHTEQQLFPVEAWDTHYIAAKSFPRGTEVDHWRIVAAETASVTVTPSVNGLTTFTLNAGQVQDIATDQDFEVTATGKILVGQFWASSNDPGVADSCFIVADLLGLGSCDDLTCTVFGGGDACVDNACAKACTNESTCDALCGGDQGCIDAIMCGGNGYCSIGTGIGDPAYALSVPVGQYRQDYLVLTPIGYQENYMTVVARRGGAPLLDGARITEPPTSATPTPLNADWDLFKFSVSEGTHLLQDNASFGVVSYGYNCDVSYAYPGGLNLEIIN